MAVGLGSVDFHGPQTAGAQLFHDLPIVLLIGFVLGLLVFRWLRGRTMFPGFSRRNIGALAVVGVLAGVGFWLGRTDSPVCDADSVWQAHGAWHVLSALVFLIGWHLLFNEGGVVRHGDGTNGTNAETRDGLGKGPS